MDGGHPFYKLSELSLRENFFLYCLMLSKHKQNNNRYEQTKRHVNIIKLLKAVICIVKDIIDMTNVYYIIGAVHCVQPA